MLFRRAGVVVRGGGDLGSGVIYRLHRAGFPVIVTELPTPKLVRRAVSFGSAVYTGQITIDGVTARFSRDPSTVTAIQAEGLIPVVIDDKSDLQRFYEAGPVILIDARMEKVNPDTTMQDALLLVITMGPGYTAGQDCHAVIETNRGHHLGRVYWEGAAEPDTGQPGNTQGRTYSRVLRAPAAGHVQAEAEIGDIIREGQVIARIGQNLVTAKFDGVLRGLIHEQVFVTPNMKIGDLDPRANRDHCFTISDKALSVGGGVLEAIFASTQLHPYLVGQ